MLGRELCRVLGEDHSVVPLDIDEIDITDRSAALDILDTGDPPDLFINAAAFVNVDRCETEADTAWQVNAVGAQTVALAAQRLGSTLLYISTDYVFDGVTDTDYDEVSTPNPINHYGRSKLAGERLSIQICPRTYSVRTAWLIGDAPGNYVDRVLDAAEKDGVVKMAPDQIESPTTTTDLVNAIGSLIETGAYGIYNVTSIGAAPRPEFSEFVLQEYGRTESVENVDVSTLNRAAARPRRTVLDCRLFGLVTGHKLPDWKDGVRQFIKSRAAKG